MPPLSVWLCLRPDFSLVACCHGCLAACGLLQLSSCLCPPPCLQRAMLENVLRACIGLAPENNMLLEFKC